MTDINDYRKEFLDQFQGACHRDESLINLGSVRNPDFWTKFATYFNINIISGRKDGDERVAFTAEDCQGYANALFRLYKSRQGKFCPTGNMVILKKQYVELLAEILKDTDMVVVDRELREAFWEDFARKLSTTPDKQYSADWCRRTAWQLACFYQSLRKDLRENFEYRDLFRKIFEGDSKIWEMLDVRRFFGRLADESSESDSRGFQDMVIRQPRYSTLHPETDWGVMTSLAQLAQENLVNLNDIACAQSSLSASSYAAFAFLNAKDNNTKADMIHSASLERKKRKYV